jgi:steroid delta-isomerase-like uncharacterized protein
MMSAMAVPTTWTRVILGFLLVMSWAVSVEGGSEMATTELHKTLIRRWIDEVWNKGDMAVADEIFAPTYVHRTPMATLSNLEAFKKAISGFRAGLPDVKVTIEDVLTDGDKVVTRWVITGTHRHELMGFAPTNKQITFSGITIQRVVDGKIVESWVEFDAGGLGQQLGGPSPGKQ